MMRMATVSQPATKIRIGKGPEMFHLFCLGQFMRTQAIRLKLMNRPKVFMRVSASYAHGQVIGATVPVITASLHEWQPII